jgi:rubredoxin
MNSFARCGPFPVDVAGIGMAAHDAPLTRQGCRESDDPSLGDLRWQVPAGTPCTALPAHRTCPQCEGAADPFTVLEAGADA